VDSAAADSAVAASAAAADSAAAAAARAAAGPVEAGRVLKHLLTPHWFSRRALSSGDRKKIQEAIKDSEKHHLGEIAFALEGGLPLHFLLRKKPARARAEDLFAHLRIWDTEHNNGVLLYVQRVDRRIEIVADRGIAARVAQGEWDAMCREMEGAFREGRFAEGALRAIERCTGLLAGHFPSAGERRRNELPDRPIVL
jgi:uncharacterized membrane protein